MKWKHIKIEQPIDGMEIIQCDPPYHGHYAIRMRKYYQKCSWNEQLEFCKQHNLPGPDFWWIYAKDFPFPDKKGEYGNT